MKRTLCAAATALLVCAMSMPAHSIEKTITVTAPKIDREQTPLSVDIRVGPGWAKAHDSPSAVINDGDIPAQAEMLDSETVRVWFIVPALEAGETVEFNLVISPESDEKPDTTVFGFSDTEGKHEDIIFGDRPVLRYMYEYDENNRHNTYKTFHQVFDSAGERIITKGPGGKYTHHRGLFMGWRSIKYDNKRFDSWHMKPGKTNQLHQKFLEHTAGPVFARQKALIHWTDPDGKPVLAEERALTVFRQEASATLIQFDSTVKSLVGEVVLNGDPEHAGFQYRPHNDVAAKTGGETKYHFRDDSKRPKGGGKGHQDQDWVGMSYTLGDSRFNVLYVPHPSNPHKPIWSTYRPYGRFGSYFKHTLKPDKPLKVKYRIWVVEDKDAPSKKQFEQRCADFINPPTITIQ